MANKKSLQAAGSSMFDKMFSGPEESIGALASGGGNINMPGAAAAVSGNNCTSINRESIVPSPFNEGLHMGNMDEYAASLRESGLIEPIVVYARDDGKYEILSGHQRFHAWCGILGNESINAIIRPYEKDPIKRFVAHTQANLLQRDKDVNFWLTRIGMARRLLAEEGFGGTEAERMRKISEMLGGISVAQLYRYESFRGLIPELQDLESRKLLSVFTLYAAATLDGAMQREVFKKVQELLEEKKASGEDEEITRTEFNLIIAAVKSAGDKEAKDGPGGEGGKRASATYIDRVGKTYGSFLKSIGKCRTMQDKKEAAEFLRRARAELEALEKELSVSQEG